MAHQIADQSIKQAAARPKPSALISSTGLVNALLKPPVLAILWMGVIAHLWKLLETLSHRVYRWDFSLYYLGAYSLRHGLDPYRADLAPMARALGIRPGELLEVPPFLILYELFTFMSMAGAYWTWCAINVVALAVALYLLIRRDFSSDRRSASAFLALVLIYPPLGIHFYYAQSQIVVLLMLVMIMRSTEQHCSAQAGLILGVVSMLRAYPLALGGYFLIRRNWRALIYAALAIAACFALTVAIAGLEPWRGFLLQLSVHTVDNHSGGPANVALVHTVSRLLALAIDSGTAFSLELTRLVTATFANLVIIMLSLKVTADSWDRPDEDWRIYSLWVVTMLLVSPVTWIHSLVLLILPFAQLTIAVAAGRASHRAIWMAAASYIMVSLAFGWHQSIGTYDTNQLSSWIAELSPLSLIAAYVSIYWFATDRGFVVAGSATAA